MLVKVFLIGYMGVGKSTIAKKLASRLGLSVLDLDQLIEQEAQLSVPELFATTGEVYFRELEHRLLNQTIQTSPGFVLATGGGTPCFYDNINQMNEAGCTIWLQLPPAKILSRISKNLQSRPLLAAVSERERLKFIKKALEDRTPFYSQAHIHFQAENTSAGRLEKLAAAVKQFYSRKTFTSASENSTEI